MPRCRCSRSSLRRGVDDRGAGALSASADHARETAGVLEERSDTRKVLDAAVLGADAKQGANIVALNVGELLGVVDYFVIASGHNVRQVATLVEVIEAKVKERTGRAPLRIEGLKDATWVLMDYGDVVVHVFLDETRDYYDLEHLWSGAGRVMIGELLSPFNPTR